MSSTADPGPSPQALPFEHTDLKAVGGYIGSEPEDFRVDELPLYEPCGHGEHWYVRVRKRLATTPALVGAVSRAAGVNERDVGYAGLKDKHAVTTQWLSLPTSAPVAPDAWVLGEGFEVLEVSKHSNKLKVGHLRGNAFTIRVEPEASEPLPLAQALCERIIRSGIGNYFGQQRFGVGQGNLAQALDELRRGRLHRKGGRRTKFASSVIQSEIFNRFLSARSSLSEALLAGDVVRLEGSRSVFLVEEPERELERLVSGDIHLTGPMVGPKCRPAAGVVAELEAQALASLDLSEKDLAALGRLAPGTRRDASLRPAALRVAAAVEGGLEFHFELPSGSYAGQVIRAFTRGGPWKPRAETPAHATC